MRGHTDNFLRLQEICVEKKLWLHSFGLVFVTVELVAVQIYTYSALILAAF